MNVDNISQAVVDRAIDQTSARMRTLSALSGTLLIGAGVIGYVAAAVVADHVVAGGLPLFLRRTALALAGMVVVLLTGACVIRPAFRRINQLYSAWLLERARPDLRHAVTTTLLLRGRNEVHAGVSSGLAFQAARAVRRIDASGVVSDRSLRRAGIAIVGMIALFCIYGLLAPKQVRPSVLRVLGADVPAPTQTQIEVAAPAPDASVVVGTTVNFEVRVRGRQPEQAWVEFSSDEGQTWPVGKRLNLRVPHERTAQAGPWTAARDGSDVGATFWYRIHAGDAQCDIRRVEVRPQPVATSHVVSITWPEYSNRRDPQKSDGPIDALIGSKAELTVRTNVPASEARVVYHGAAGDFSRQMSIDDADRRMLRAAWVVDRDLEYEVRFNDGHGAGNPDPIRYTQRARGDRAAEIAQTAPQGNFTAFPTDVFKIQARIVDDWGLSRVALAYRGLHGSGVIELADDGRAGRPIIEIDTTVAVESLAAQPGDLVELHLEATDTRVNLRGERDLQITRGPVSELRVVGGTGTGGGKSPQPGAKGGGPGKDKNGSQSSGTRKEGPDSQGKGVQPQDSGAGNKPGADAGPGETSQPSTKGAAGDANQPGEPGKAENSESKSGESTSAADQPEHTGPPSDGAASDSSKPMPSDKNEPVATDDSAAPNGQAARSDGDSDAQPTEGGKDADSAEAQAELDRLIRKNQDALERLTTERGEAKGESPADSGGSRPPGDPDKKATADSPSAKDKPSGGQEQPGNGAKSEAGQSGGKPDSNSTGDSKTPSTDKSKPAAGAGQPSAPKPGDVAKPGDDSSPPSKGGEAEEATGASKPDEGQRSKGASDREAPEQDGDAKGEGEAKPGDAQPADSDQGKADSGKFAKDPAKNGEAKDQPPGASTPKPANGIGPTPESSGGGVEEDAGPSQADGAFEKAGKSDPLDSPLRERARKAVEELERRLRDGGVSDSELRDLGWSRAEARNFVTRFRRLQEAAQEQRDGGLFSGRTREGLGEAKAGTSDTGSGVGRGMSGAVRGDSNVRKDANHADDAPPESVPPELKDVLDEYYRSMARQDGAKPKPKADK